jgi:phosphoglycolate phosphatase
VLFIFDWDGTLCDSKSTITRAMQQAACDMGWQPLADPEIHEIIGLGLPEALARLYPQVSTEERSLLRDAYAANFIAFDQQQPANFFPDVKQTLDLLKAQGHTLTVATGKSRRGLERIFGVMGLDGFFHASRCADETASKPDPLMLHEILAEFDAAAHEAVMVGDTEFDMDMAARIQMPRIAVSYGAHHPDRLQVFAPEMCLDNFADLLDWGRLKP